MVLLQLKDPLELFMKSREFLHGSGFLSKTQFLPSFLLIRIDILISFLFYM